MELEVCSVVAKELAPDIILFNNSVNLENGKQHVNSINRKILELRKPPTTPGQENNSNSYILYLVKSVAKFLTQ